MSLFFNNSQLAWFSGRKKFHTNGGDSPFQGDGEGEGLVQALKTTHLNSLPLPKGRGERGRRVNFSFSTLTIYERSRS